MSLTATDGHVRVVVTDNGAGIDKAELDAIEASQETQPEHSSGFGL